jgi:hypothetical protein
MCRPKGTHLAVHIAQVLGSPGADVFMYHGQRLLPLCEHEW